VIDGAKLAGRTDNMSATATNRVFAYLAMLVAAMLLPACTTAPKPETIGKVKLLNITLIWLREPGSDADRQRVIGVVHHFAREIPEVQRLSVGPPFPYGGPGLDSSFDICLVLQFEDEDALDRYAKHPAFQAAQRDILLPLTKQVKVYNVVSE
jgi:hypothetical protein